MVTTKSKKKLGLGIRLRLLQIQWQKQLGDILRPVGLNITQYFILMGLELLQKDGQKVSQSELSQFSQISPMMTSIEVRKMEKNGWLMRKESKLDTRANQILLSRKGKSLINEANEGVEQLEKEFFSRLGKDQKAFESFLTVLSR